MVWCKAGAVRLLGLMVFALVAACGGGGGGGGGASGGSAAPAPANPTYSISGSVSGLNGTGLVLQDNGGDNLTVTANGNFTFKTGLANGVAYNVAVLTPPAGPTQTCTVIGGVGTVTNANISGIAVACTTNSYTIGGTVSGLAGTGLVLTNNGGDNLAIGANGAFTFVTPVLSGAAYNVAVLTPPTGPAQTCSAIGGAGTAGGANVANVSVYCYTPTLPRYAFSLSLNGIGSYVVDPATGRFKLTARNMAAASPGAIAVDPTGKYAYVVSSISANTVLQFTIGANGSLTPMVPATVATGPGPVHITIDPTGKYVYVANSNAYVGPGSISEYAIGATGGLVPVGAGTIAAGTMPTSVTVDPTGRYLYVTNNPVVAGYLSQYTIGAGGVLTPMATPTIPAAYNPNSVTIDPTGTYLYLWNTNATGTFIAQYTIGAGGSLSATATVPVSTVGGGHIAIDPSGRYLYMTTPGFGSNNSISQFTIGANGSLIPMVPATVATGVFPSSILADPSGKYLYVGMGYGTAQYIIGANGALTPNAPGSVQTAAPLAMTHGAVPVQAVPQTAYVANYGSNTVSQFTVGANGSLAQMAPATVTAGTNPTFITVDPVGQFAFALNFGSNNVSKYTIGASGILVPVSPFPTFTTGSGPKSMAYDPAGLYTYEADSTTNTVYQSAAAATPIAAGTSPQSVAVDPSGNYVYVANAGSNDVSAYSILTSSALLQVSCGAPGTAGCSGAVAPTNFAAGLAPQSVTIDPSGRYVYVANKGGNTVSQFTIGAGGMLVATGTAAAGTTPVSVTLDPSGKYAYVANSFNGAGGNSVSQYTIGAGGSLVPMVPATVAAGTGPQSITVDAAGKFAYVANQLGNDVSVYTIGAGGALTQVICAAPSICGTPGNFAAGTSPASVVTTSTWQ